MVHTEDRVDPVADLEIIHHELRLKDIERMEKIAEGLAKVTLCSDVFRHVQHRTQRPRARCSLCTESRPLMFLADATPR